MCQSSNLWNKSLFYILHWNKTISKMYSSINLLIIKNSRLSSHYQRNKITAGFICPAHTLRHIWMHLERKTNLFFFKYLEAAEIAVHVSLCGQALMLLFCRNYSTNNVSPQGFFIIWEQMCLLDADDYLRENKASQAVKTTRWTWQQRIKWV